jgi:hypothetical protein
MSAKGDLLDAIRAYTREVRNTPGQQDLTAQLEELRRTIDQEPTPEPDGVPPTHGQDTGENTVQSTPGTHVHINVSPEKSAAMAMMQGK